MLKAFPEWISFCIQINKSQTFESAKSEIKATFQEAFLMKKPKIDERTSS